MGNLRGPPAIPDKLWAMRHVVGTITGLGIAMAGRVSAQTPPVDPAPPPESTPESNPTPSVEPAAAPGSAPAPETPAQAAEDFNRNLAEDFKSFDWLGVLHDIWTAQLFHAGDTSIRLNQIVIALLVVVIGLWLARRVANRVAARLGKLKRIDPNFAAAAHKLVFFVLTLIALFIALPIAGIPMTIFTVLGGAFAIGVGFGAQNLCNNLICGLILMIERPVRLGDIVEIGDQQGKVEDIGNRCTRLRRFDGVDVLVPNSSILQNPLINWTLKDADVRGSVAVGVAYGSPVDTVRDLIDRAAQEHGRILRSPQPEVLFTDFGDNALGFEVLFWTAVTRPLDLRRIESDLRFRIDKLFREAEISISFPQRDVHLDTLRPLEVRLSRDAPPQAPADSPTPNPPLPG